MAPLLNISVQAGMGSLTEEGVAEYGPAVPDEMSLEGGTGWGGVTWEALSLIPEADQGMSSMGGRGGGDPQKGQ